MHSGSSDRLPNVVDRGLVDHIGELCLHKLLAKLGEFKVVPLSPADLRYGMVRNGTGWRMGCACFVGGQTPHAYAESAVCTIEQVGKKTCGEVRGVVCGKMQLHLDLVPY